MPLAILLAAAWVEVLSPAEILAEMGINLDFLRTEWADLPPRQRSMRLTFDYSWNLLDEDERRAFQALCVFRGAFTRQAAQAVSGAGASELRRLVDKSLLMPMPGEWFSVHELLRQYGLEKLNENPDESARVHQQYSAYYLQKLADWEQGLKGARQSETLALLSLKITDLRLAWEIACQRDEVERLGSSLGGLCLFYEQSTRLAEGRSLCQESIAMMAQSNTPAQRLFMALVLIWQCRFSRLLGEHALAAQYLEKSQALVKGLASSALDLKVIQAMILLEAAERLFFSDVAEAGRLLRASLDLFHSAGDAWRVAGVLCRLGLNRGFIGDFSESDRLLGEAIELYQSLGYVLGIASARRIMAQNQVRLGKLESGLALMRQVIADSQTSDNRAQMALDQRTLGVVLGWNGLYSEAQTLFQESLVVADDLGDLYEKTFITLFLGAIDLFTGQYETSSQLIARSLDLAQHNGFDREAAFCMWVLGGNKLAESSPQAARRYYLESIKIYRQVGLQDELCWALALDAFCLLQLGEDEEATRRLDEAMEIALTIRGYLSALFALLGCALKLRLKGELEAALELHTLVAVQPIFARSTWFADVFGVCIAAHSARLDPAVAASARQRGLQRSIWDSVREMQMRLSLEGGDYNRVHIPAC
jgi:tetratricopeptide (TPR) repeat protein